MGKLQNSLNWARIAQILSVLTFVVACWVAHRSLQVRSDCIHSPAVAAVFFSDLRVLNCRYQSRLNLGSLIDPLPYHIARQVRLLEVLEPLKAIMPARSSPFAVAVVNAEPRKFELDTHHLLLGRAWLDQPMQVRRALTMAWLNTQFPEYYKDSFHRELIADLIALVIFREDQWESNGEVFSMRSQLRFPVVAPTLDSYCRSPFRSLAHGKECTGEQTEAFEAKWGFRPLLAVAMTSIIEKLPMQKQLMVVGRIRSGIERPVLPVLGEARAEVLVHWFQTALPAYLTALGLDLQDQDVAAGLKHTYKVLEIDAPIRWELTVDLTHTPVWKEIVEQLKKRNRFRPNERMLVFTPEGPLAFPGAFPVAWEAEDVRSQKHVMIACAWPGRNEAPAVQARQIFAEQSCGRLTRAFWD